MKVIHGIIFFYGCIASVYGLYALVVHFLIQEISKEEFWTKRIFHYIPVFLTNISSCLLFLAGVILFSTNTPTLLGMSVDSAEMFALSTVAMVIWGIIIVFRFLIICVEDRPENRVANNESRKRRLFFGVWATALAYVSAVVYYWEVFRMFVDWLVHLL